MNRKDQKVLFVCKDLDDVTQIESVWADKVGEYYRIENIPFLGDFNSNDI